MPRMAMGTRENDQPAMWIATSDLPTSPGHPFYTRLNAILEAEGFDRFCRRPVPAILCTGDGPPRSGAWPVFPAAADRVLRRDRCGTRHCVARRRFAGRAGVPAAGPGGGDAGPLHDLAHAPLDRCRDASSGLYLDPAATGVSRPAER